MNELVTLRKIEQSKLAIREVKNLDEIKKVIDQGEALRAYAKSAKMSAEIQADIAELNLIAERRLGEISAAMEKSKGGQPHQKKSTCPKGGQVETKTAALAKVGVTRQRASEAERLAKIDDGVFNDLLKTAREKSIPKTDIKKLARMDKAKQRAVADKISTGEAKSVIDAQRKVLKENIVSQYKDAPKGKSKSVDIHTTKNKYRVIYADPPWAYGDSRSGAGTTGATDHYPTMPLKDICALPVKDITDDNAVLFLWVTSPLLEDCFSVIKAWGFKYKASFVWDKIKHNMGHYNSVRHELLLICTKGSCVPDNAKLYDSVQSIERGEHSEKPEEFRDIINTLYDSGKKLELFARKQADNWDTWGFEA
jgi:site-specific DNA-methyltransferase (adenine-specific)